MTNDGWRAISDLVVNGDISYGIVQPGAHVENGVPIVRAGDIARGTIATSSPLRVDPEVAASFRRTSLLGGEVLVSLVGSVGNAAVANAELAGWNVARAVAVLRPMNVESRWLAWAMELPEVQRQIRAVLNTTVQPTLNLGDLKGVTVPIADPETRRGIAEVLGAFDDKIAANRTLVEGVTELSGALVAAPPSVRELALADIAVTLTRGIAPKYADEGLLVLNQKCIRDGLVSLDQARWTQPLAAENPKRLVRNDVLVNSTGMGTLGRVARWVRDLEATADSHVSIVRFDPALVDPVFAGVVLAQQEARVEALAEGSTGQTELSRAQLGALTLRLPSLEAQRATGEVLCGLEARQTAALDESEVLARTRDELLPLLMSGKLTVKDAEKRAEEVL